jgi:hypothetical protein
VRRGGSLDDQPDQIRLWAPTTFTTTT